MLYTTSLTPKSPQSTYFSPSSQYSVFALNKNSQLPSSYPSNAKFFRMQKIKKPSQLDPLAIRNSDNSIIGYNFGADPTYALRLYADGVFELV